MTKMLSVVSCAAVLAVSGFGSANAQSFKPAPGVFKAVGNLELFQTIKDVNCNVEAIIEVNASGQAYITSMTFSPGHPLCGTAIRPLSPPPPQLITGSSSGTDEASVNINVNIQAGAGTCSGVLAPMKLYWGSKGPNRIATDPTATVSGSPSTCYATGYLNITPVAPTVGELKL